MDGSMKFMWEARLAWIKEFKIGKIGKIKQ